MENITLVEASAGLYEPGVFTRHSHLEPLALEYLASVLKKEGYKTNILQQREEPADKFLKKILGTKPNLVAFSTFTYSFPYSKNLAGMIKGTNNKIYTVFGGVHVSSYPQSIDDKAIDFIVLGEGEHTLLDLVKTLDNGGRLENVNGIAYWDDGIKITEPRKRIENLDELPFPLRPKTILEKTRINTLMYPTKSEQKGVASIAYSRGCSYGCSFCASKNIWGKTVNWRSVKSIVDEIEELQRQFRTNTIFFTDLTFNLDKGKVLELCDELTKQKISVSWDAMLRATSPDGSLLVDKGLLEAMKKAKCAKVSYGLESLISEIQEVYNKKGEINALKQILELGNSIGLINKGYLIIGEPKLETKETLDYTKEILKELSLDELRISFLTPFPNTSTYFECEQEKRIITKNWAKYTSDEPILELDHLNKEELIEARKKIFREFYQNSSYEKRMKSKIKRFPHLKKSYDEHLQFLEQKEVLE